MVLPCGISFLLKLFDLGFLKVSPLPSLARLLSVANVHPQSHSGVKHVSVIPHENGNQNCYDEPDLRDSDAVGPSL